MALPPSSLRRCAAWATLSPVLDEEAVIAALWLQQEHMRGDSVSDIIRFIDQIADRHLLDAATRRKLYEAYHQALRRPQDELPMDPWPLMQAATPEPSPAARQAPPPEPRDEPPPRRVEAPQAGTPPPPEAHQASPSAPEAAPATVVFASLCTGMIHEVQALHRAALPDLHDALFEQLERSRLAHSLKPQLAAAWKDGTRPAWQLQADEKTLAEVVSLLYVALCESLGPVHADTILTSAVKRATQLPQASEFSPRRLI